MNKQIIRLDDGKGDIVTADTLLVYLKEQYTADGPTYKLGKSGGQKKLRGLAFDQFDQFRYGGDVNIKYPIIFVFSLKQVCEELGLPVPAEDADGNAGVPKYDDVIRDRLQKLGSNWTNNMLVKNAKSKGLDPEGLGGHTPKLHDQLIEAVKNVSCARSKHTMKPEGSLRDYQVPTFANLMFALKSGDLALLRCFGGWGKSYLALLISSIVWQESQDGYVLCLSPVRDNIEDFITAADKNAWDGRNVCVRRLSSFKKNEFASWLGETQARGEVPFVVATVQDVRGKSAEDIEDTDELDDAATEDFLRKLHTKYGFLLKHKLSLFLRDEIHLHFASPRTLKTLSVLNAAKTLDMTATLTGREAATFEYKPEQIVTYSLLHALLEKTKVDGFADIKSLPDLEIRVVTDFKLNDESMKELDGFPQEQWLASKLFALKNKELLHPRMVVDFVSRVFSLGIWESKVRKWDFALRVEKVQSDTWMLIVPRGDKNGGARRKIDLLVSMLNEALDDAVFVSGYEMRGVGTLEDRVESLKREPQNRNKPIIIVTHRVLLTGVNIPQLEGIALADKIGSQALFMQTLYRLFRKWPAKKSTVMTCYEPGTAITDLSAAIGLGTLIKDHVDGGGSVREIEGLIHLKAYDGTGRITNLGAEFLLNATEEAARKTAERLLSGITEQGVLSALDTETLQDILLMDSVGDGITGSKDDDKTDITTGNDGKGSKPGEKKVGDKKDEKEEAARQLKVIAAMLCQAPLLAMNRKFAGVLGANIDPVAVMSDALIKFTWGDADQKLVLRALHSEALKTWAAESLKHRLHSQLAMNSGEAAMCASGVLGSKGKGQQQIILDGAVAVEAMMKRIIGTPKTAMVVNPKAGQLILALQARFPGIEIEVPIVVNKDQDDRGFIPQLESLGATCIEVAGDIECGTMRIMKFDLIIGNPPYKAGMHLDFLRLGLKHLADDGQLVFVHPAEWLVQKRDTPKSRKYKALRDELMARGRTEITFIDNPWVEAGVGLFVPLTITSIAPGKGCSLEDTRIRQTYGPGVDHPKREKTELTSLDDVTQFGSPSAVSSMLAKIWSHEDRMNEHEGVKVGNHFVNLSRMTGNGKTTSLMAGQERSFFNMYGFVNNTSSFVTDAPQIAKAQGGKAVGNEKIWLSFATREEAQNCLDFLTKTKFFRAFLATIKIDQHAANNLLRFIPWLDWTTQWNDEALNKLFKFTKDEIKAIDEIVDLITIK